MRAWQSPRIFCAAPGRPAFWPLDRRGWSAGKRGGLRDLPGGRRAARHAGEACPFRCDGKAPPGAPLAASRPGLRRRHRPRVRASWDEATCQSPVQRAPRGGVVLPPGRFPGPPERGATNPARRRRAHPAEMTSHDNAPRWVGWGYRYMVIGRKSRDYCKIFRSLRCAQLRRARKTGRLHVLQHYIGEVEINHYASFKKMPSCHFDQLGGRNAYKN
jgi:hypothetical protein